MRDAGRQLTNALEFLRLPKLQFQAHAIGNVGSRDDEPRGLAILRRNAHNLQPQEPGFALTLIRQIVGTIDRLRGQPALNLCFHLRMQAI